MMLQDENLSSMQNKIYRITYMGMFISLAIALSYIEYLIPFNYGLTGTKIGLANIAVILSMYVFKEYYGIIINLIRIFIIFLFMGNVYSFMFSLAGGIVSFLVMLIVKKTGKVDIMGVSITGGVFHNVAQLLVAVYVIKYNILFYMPVMIITGIISGIIVGIISNTVLKIFGLVKKVEK